ncbi:MAG: hypothetical protein JWM89_2910 [Acidimicrobiales bacterium]|nr:hypothetical protein [Acidimicrobiales bacterium]
MPRRLQHRRGVALPAGARYVGRPSRWGNRYVFEARAAKAGRILVGSRAEAVERYEADLLADPDRVADARRELAGADLACYCSLDGPCHGDVLLRIANGSPASAGGHGAVDGRDVVDGLDDADRLDGADGDGGVDRDGGGGPGGGLEGARRP